MDEGPIELKDPAQGKVDIVEPDDLAVEAEIIWDDEVAGEASPAPDGGARDNVDRAGPEKPAALPGQNINARSRPRRPSPRPADPEVRASSAPAASTAKPSPRATPTTGRPEAARRRQATTLDPGPGLDSRWRKPWPGQAICAAANSPRIRPPSSPRPRVRRPARTGHLRLDDLATAPGEPSPGGRIGRTEGIPALEEGKFDNANQLLSAAREAVDALGGAVEDAEEIRHAADEATILVNLLTDSLESLLDEAARTSPRPGPTGLTPCTRDGRSIIDATITATPDTPGSNRYELDYLVLAAGEGAREPTLCPDRPDRFRGDYLGRSQGGRSGGLRRPAWPRSSTTPRPSNG